MQAISTWEVWPMSLLNLLFAGHSNDEMLFNTDSVNALDPQEKCRLRGFPNLVKDLHSLIHTFCDSAPAYFTINCAIGQGKNKPDTKTNFFGLICSDLWNWADFWQKSRLNCQLKGIIIFRIEQNFNNSINVDYESFSLHLWCKALPFKKWK